MSFSWSAPRFTELDEKLERESLSESESREVFDDLVGAYESPQEHPELLSLTDETFHRLLAGTPRCVKDAYADALERAPDLVATETPPLVFLRATDFQPDAAVKRLASYWRWRVKLFGIEKALLAMTRDGALSCPQDLDVLQQSLITLTSSDKKGRSVLFVNRSKMTRDVAPRDRFLRVLFYMCHRAILDSESCQRHGVVILVNMKDFDIAKCMDRNLTKSIATLLTEALPIKLKAMHTCFQTTGKSLYDLVLPSVKYVLGRHIRLRLVSHFDGEAVFCSHMEERYGICWRTLPKVLTGCEPVQEETDDVSSS